MQLSHLEGIRDLKKDGPRIDRSYFSCDIIGRCQIAPELASGTSSAQS
jgi:hypothetical protein